MGGGNRGPRGGAAGDDSKGDDRLTFNEPRDVLPDEGDPLAVRVSPDGAGLALELSGASDDIFGERISCQLSESWPLHQRRHLLQRNAYRSESGILGAQKGQRIEQAPNNAPPYLAVERDRRLIKPGLLRVPDVRGDDLVERQVLSSVRLELHPVFLGFDGQLTAHGILDVKDRRIQRIDCEPHIVFGTAAAAEWAEEKNFAGATRP